MKQGEKTREQLVAEVAKLRQRIADLEEMDLVREPAEKERYRRHGHHSHLRTTEGLAKLAGGIAHEFNNALSEITVTVDLLEIDLQVDVDPRKSVEAIKTSVRRMANLTNQLLAYAGGGKYHPRNILLNDFLQLAQPLVQYTIDPDISVETDLQRDIFAVQVDLPQMQMALSAILANAAEAIEGKGRIKIITRNEEIGQAFAKDHPDVKQNPYACLIVEDDGKGMDVETLNRLFDPFFTTKFQGRGLSMAAVHGIVKSHDGWISVNSEVGTGTTVRLYLSAVEATRTAQ
ncbi:MAG: hypothetical protein JSU72_12820 [Deltaproteobacteria bacterium]|nr:MAG: hypothetical protein JSU72_12820 [Deltaproteobacteria bacterium]